MELLARKIEERLNSHKVCRIFNGDLNHIWPTSDTEKREREKRIEQIRKYADSHGWLVNVYDSSPQAVFRKKVDSNQNATFHHTLTKGSPTAPLK